MSNILRTKVPQVLDAVNRISEVVYMEAINQSFQDEAFPKTVKFQSVLRILVNEIKTVSIPKTLKNELDEDYIIFENEEWVYPRFQEFLRRESVYKQTTFKSNFGALSYNDFDANKGALMIQEVHIVNNNICNPLETNCNYFWYLQANDMEVVSDTELEQLLTPYKLEP